MFGPVLGVRRSLLINREEIGIGSDRAGPQSSQLRQQLTAHSLRPKLDGAPAASDEELLQATAIGPRISLGRGLRAGLGLGARSGSEPALGVLAEAAVGRASATATAASSSSSSRKPPLALFTVSATTAASCIAQQLLTQKQQQQQPHLQLEVAPIAARESPALVPVVDVELGRRLQARRRHWGSLESSWLVKNAFAEWRRLLISGMLYAQAAEEAADLEVAQLRLVAGLQKLLIEKEQYIQELEKRLSELASLSGDREPSSPATRRDDRAACSGRVLESRATNYEAQLLLGLGFAAFQRATYEARLQKQVAALEERLRRSEKARLQCEEQLAEFQARLADVDELKRVADERAVECEARLKVSEELARDKTRAGALQLERTEELLRESFDCSAKLKEELLVCQERACGFEKEVRRLAAEMEASVSKGADRSLRARERARRASAVGCRLARECMVHVVAAAFATWLRFSQRGNQHRGYVARAECTIDRRLRFRLSKILQTWCVVVGRASGVRSVAVRLGEGHRRVRLAAAVAAWRHACERSRWDQDAMTQAKRLSFRLLQRGCDITEALVMSGQVREDAQRVLAAWRQLCLEAKFGEMQFLARRDRDRSIGISERLVFVGQLWLLLVDLLAAWRLASRKALDARRAALRLGLGCDAAQKRSLLSEWGRLAKQKEHQTIVSAAEQLARSSEAARVKAGALLQQLRWKRLTIGEYWVMSQDSGFLVFVLATWRRLAEVFARERDAEDGKLRLQQHLLRRGAGIAFQLVHVSELRMQLKCVIAAWSYGAVRLRQLRRMVPVLSWATVRLWAAALFEAWKRAYVLGLALRRSRTDELLQEETALHLLQRQREWSEDRRRQEAEKCAAVLLSMEKLEGRSQRRALLVECVSSWSVTAAALRAARKRAAVQAVRQLQGLLGSVFGYWLAAFQGRAREDNFQLTLQERECELRGLLEGRDRELEHRRRSHDSDVEQLRAEARSLERVARQRGADISDVLLFVKDCRAVAAEALWCWKHAAELAALRTRASQIAASMERQCGDIVAFYRSRGRDISGALALVGNVRLLLAQAFGAWRLKSYRIKTGLALCEHKASGYARGLLAVILHDWKTHCQHACAVSHARQYEEDHATLARRLRGRAVAIAGRLAAVAARRQDLQDAFSAWRCVQHNSVVASLAAQRAQVFSDMEAARFRDLQAYGLINQRRLLACDVLALQRQLEALLSDVVARWHAVALRMKMAYTAALGLCFKDDLALRSAAFKRWSRQSELGVAESQREDMLTAFGGHAETLKARGVRIANELARRQLCMNIAMDVMAHWQLACNSARLRSARLIVRSTEDRFASIADELLARESGWSRTAAVLAHWQRLCSDARGSASLAVGVRLRERAMLAAQGLALAADRGVMLRCVFDEWRHEAQRLRLLRRKLGPLLAQKNLSLLLASVLSSWRLVCWCKRADVWAQHALAALRGQLMARGSDIADCLELRAQLRRLLASVVHAWKRFALGAFLQLKAIGSLARRGSRGGLRQALQAWSRQAFAGKLQTMAATSYGHRSGVRVLLRRVCSEWHRVAAMALLDRCGEHALRSGRAFLEDRAKAVGGWALCNGRRRRDLLFTLRAWQHLCDLSLLEKDGRHKLQRRTREVLFFHCHRGRDARFLSRVLAGWLRARDARCFAILREQGQRKLLQCSAREEMVVAAACDAFGRDGRIAAAQAAFVAWAKRCRVLRELLRRGGLREVLVETCCSFWIFAEWRLQTRQSSWSRKQQEMAALLAQAGAQLAQASAETVQKGRDTARRSRRTRHLANRLVELHWACGLGAVFSEWVRIALQVQHERMHERQLEELTGRTHAVEYERRRATIMRERAVARHLEAAAWQVQCAVWAAWKHAWTQTVSHEARHQHSTLQQQGSATLLHCMDIAQHGRRRAWKTKVYMAWQLLTERHARVALAERRQHEGRTAVQNAFAMQRDLLLCRLMAAWRLETLLVQIQVASPSARSLTLTLGASSPREEELRAHPTARSSSEAAAAVIHPERQPGGLTSVASAPSLGVWSPSSTVIPLAASFQQPQPAQESVRLRAASADRVVVLTERVLRAATSTTCSCGNEFVEDAIFCRKCGRRRPREKRRSLPGRAQVHASAPAAPPSEYFQSGVTSPRVTTMLASPRLRPESYQAASLQAPAVSTPRSVEIGGLHLVRPTAQVHMPPAPEGFVPDGRFRQGVVQWPSEYQVVPLLGQQAQHARQPVSVPLQQVPLVAARV
eukprot:TRINITY_DN64259_c0_g1_i1.p1 TRINITY_DN64259_c0_g1~~TRINITY_DN64259_c0_g1_i1.p1  ORF type:complete len:2241 (+),score=462.94 TRINITY_DN64259_c0_g1_i1:191-6913(+)